MGNLEQMVDNKNVQNEVKALKDDMQDILSRLNNLKGQSKEIMSEQFSEVLDKFSDLKGQSVEKGKEYYHNMEEYVKAKPAMTALYAFAAGALVAILLKK